MNTDSASLTFSVTVNAVPTLASSPSTLTEDNLDGATLTVTLPTGFTFNAGVSAASFQLLTNPALADLSINTLSGGAMGTTTATLTLATGPGYGFDATATLAIRVLAWLEARLPMGSASFDFASLRSGRTGAIVQDFLLFPVQDPQSPLPHDTCQCYRILAR